MEKKQIKEFIKTPNKNFAIHKYQQYVGYNKFEYRYYPMFRYRKGIFSYEWSWFHDKEGINVYFDNEDDALKYLRQYI